MANVNHAMDELGIPMEDLRPSINFDNVNDMTDEDILNFRDHRCYNVLMLASEAGHIEAVKKLIERGEDVNFEVETESATSLAYVRGHHQVVLTLLKANAKIPNNFNEETASDELKAFVDLSEVMHERVSGANEADEVGFEATKDFLRDKIEENPSVRHFYDKSNVSLLKRAALCSMFGIYKLLLTLNIFFAPHEDLEDIFDQLVYSHRRKLREVTFEVCPNLLTEDLMILMRNCKLGPDTPEDRQSECLKLIYEAFRALFQVESLAVVLRVVAASHSFRFVFDFSRTSIQFLDPSSEPYTEGLCYLSGRIYIAAQDLLDPSTAFNTVGVIAHELCHYAMFLVYGNVARPYKVNNLRNAERFELISQECERLKESEELIKVVYDCYDEEAQHAELIVRPCHMRGLYLNALEILNEKMEIFANLFNYFDEVCVREMEAAIPKIQSKFNPFKKAQRRNKIQKRIIFTLVISLLIGASLSVWGWFELRPLTWSELSLEDQNLFKNASVNFHGVDFKFGELFANDSNVYDLLSSEQIKSGLKNETKELSNAIDQTYENFVFLKFSNMTKELKEKFVEFKVNFQGQNVSLKSLTKNKGNFELLNSSQTKEIFKDLQIKISEETEIKTKFLIERFFINEDEWIYSSHYENGRVNTSHNDIKNYEKIVENLKQEKVFLLSSIAGEGKSTTFRHFSQKLKEEFPTKWIQFVDLKKHSKAYEQNKILKFSIEENLLNFLSLDLLKLEGFELKVFIELFESGNLIFLFDGIDEVSPIYKDFMIHLTTSIKSETENFQLISTRPQHSKEFERNLNFKAQKFVPLGTLEVFELSIKFIAYERFNVDGNELVKVLNQKSLSDENFVDFEEFTKFTQKLNLSSEVSLKIHSTIEKSFKILKSSEINSEIIENPLLIRLIAEMSSEDFEVTESLNLYELYKIFIEKKFKIVHEEKGDIVNKDVIKVQTDSSVNIMQVHQVYAIKLLNIRVRSYDEITYNSLYLFTMASKDNFQIMKSIEKVSKEKISRFEILQVFSRDDFDFVHRTFAEFFVAQYVIDTFNDLNNDSNPNDEGNILILYNLLFDKSFEGSRKFLINFLESETEFSPFFEFLHKTFTKETNYKTEKVQYVIRLLAIMNFFNGNYQKYLPLLIDTIDFQSDWFEIFWKDLKNAQLNKDFLFSSLSFRDSEGRTFLHNFFMDENPIVEPFFSFLNDTFNSSQISSLFLMEDNNNLNLLGFVINRHKYEIFLQLWGFIEEKISESDQKKLLVMENSSCGNALQFSAYNYLDIFIKKNYTDEKIGMMLMETNLSCPTTLLGLIRNSTIQDLMKYLQNNKEEFKILLMNRDEDDDTIFDEFYYRFYGDKIKIFRNIFKTVLTVNENYKENLKFLELRNFYWDFNDFNFAVSNWEKIHASLGTERFKTLLSSKEIRNESFLFDIAKLNENENLLQEFLIKTKNFLNEKEFSKLFEKNEFNQTALMFAVKSEKNEENLRIFWEFLDKNLDENERKKFLAVKDIKFFTALQHSTFKEDPNSFLFVKEIYGKFFTQDEIRKILMEVHPEYLSFIKKTIELSNFNGCQTTANYLKEIFVNEKQNLQKLLSHRISDGRTIFSFYKDDEEFKEKVKIFEELLRFTFEGTQKNFEESLKVSEIASKVLEFFEQPPLSRSFYWDSNYFDYVANNWENLHDRLGSERFKNLLLSKNQRNESLLFDIALVNENENLLQEFLTKTKNFVTEKEFLELVEENEYNQTPLMYAASHKNEENLKLFWEFLDKFFNENEKKNMLAAKDELLYTALQWSTYNQDPNSFLFMKEIYEKFFTQDEIRKILMEVHPEYPSFIYNTIELSNANGCQTTANYLKELFVNEKENLQKLLSHGDDDGDTIFSYFKNEEEFKEKVKIFEELLRFISEGTKKNFDEHLKNIESKKLVKVN